MHFGSSEDNPAHAVTFKQLEGEDDIYPARIGLDWFWIGSHSDYDRLI